MSQIAQSPQYGSTCLAVRWSSLSWRDALICRVEFHFSKYDRNGRSRRSREMNVPRISCASTAPLSSSAKGRGPQPVAGQRVRPAGRPHRDDQSRRGAWP
jgi:hypothetical protein